MDDNQLEPISRRRFLQALAAMGLLGGWRFPVPDAAGAAAGPGQIIRVRDGGTAELVIGRTPVLFGGRRGTAITINGTVPGPLLRFREGETVTLRVTNRLDESTSIHWHGLLVPQEMDGVTGVSFPGIMPGETFTYRFPVRQNGTYWYHSHQGLQEQAGHYAPMIIEPAGRDPVEYDREHAVFLSDWTFENPARVLAKLKKQGDYYNFQQRTVVDFFRDAAAQGLGTTLRDRLMWGRMRMSPTDIADVTGYTYIFLMNGLAPQTNWTGLFRPGERVRLRFINGAASTFFNVRIPGLEMTVVQADGQNVIPVLVDEFQLAVAETLDVIVRPQKESAYTIFAEAMDRSGYARGTLAVRPGLSAPVPELRERPLRTMVDMGMEMEGMDMEAMARRGNQAGMSEMAGMTAGGMAGMGHGNGAAGGAGGHAGMHGMEGHEATGGGHAEMPDMAQAGPIIARHGPEKHGPANTAVAEVQRNRLGERPTGLEKVPHRVLVYTDLQALEPNPDPRPPEREIEVHLTGNMETFMWGFDGRKFSEIREPIYIDYGERVRITMVNDTMMEHPMHIHGTFMEIVNGAEPARRPRKHTISVKAAERLSFDFTGDDPGNWAFHCHLLYHMDAGMMRVVNVGLPAGEVRS